MTTTFTIDRAKWLNGSLGDIDSVLCDTKGRKCCLGFYAQACGAKLKDLKGIGYPHQVAQAALPDEMNWLVGAFGNGFTGLSSQAAQHLVIANDDDRTTRRDRERTIREQFKEQGIKVSFVGTYPVKAKKV